MKVKRESEVAQLCLTLSDPMDCSLPGSSVHGIFQARVLEWGAIAFSRDGCILHKDAQIPAGSCLCAQVAISSKLGKYRNKSGLTLFIAQLVKNPPAMQETWVQSLGWEDPLEKEMATHSSTLAWKIPWTEDTSMLQSMGFQRVRHD